MNLFITLCASLVCVSLGQFEWFYNLFSSDTNAISNDLFSNTYLQTKNNAKDIQNKIQDQDEKRFNSLPKYGAGTLGGYVTSLIGSAKNATGMIINGIRYTTSEVSRSIMETAANIGADLLLAQYKLVARTIGVGSDIPLPNIESSGYVYTVSATGGYFRSLSSLEKSGRINVTFQDSGTVIIEIPMRFSQMQVGYKNITGTFGYFVTYSGSFTIEVKNNSLSIKLRLGMASTCAIRVEEVKITQLEGITVNLDGFNSYMNSITETISNYLIYYMENVISSQIQQAVNSTITETFSYNSAICSSFIPVQYQ